MLYSLGMDTQQRFEAFMADQIAAIEASGCDPEQWIAEHSAQFRVEWDAAHPVN